MTVPEFKNKWFVDSLLDGYPDVDSAIILYWSITLSPFDTI